MSDKKIIAVVGATGAQGGGLARAILADPDSPFSVRAITRNAGSDNAKALKKAGAELFEADVDDPERLKKAFEGAYGAYCVTFFWEHLSPEKENEHAKNMAEAAKSANLQHVVWSTLEDTRKWVPLNDDRMPTLSGNYKVPHYDAKGESNHFFSDLNLPVTFLYTVFYWDNLIYFGMGPKKGEDGEYYFTLPMGDKKLPGIAAEDIGRCAKGIFEKGENYIGKSVGIAGGFLTGREMAESLGKALGVAVHYNSVTPAEYRSFGFPGADDLGNMFQFKRDFEQEYCASRDIDESRALNPSLQSFDRWLSSNKDRIPLE